MMPDPNRAPPLPPLPAPPPLLLPEAPHTTTNAGAGAAHAGLPPASTHGATPGLAGAVFGSACGSSTAQQVSLAPPLMPPTSYSTSAPGGGSAATPGSSPGLCPSPSAHGGPPPVALAQHSPPLHPAPVQPPLPSGRPQHPTGGAPQAPPSLGGATRPPPSSARLRTWVARQAQRIDLHLAREAFGPSFCALQLLSLIREERIPIQVAYLRGDPSLAAVEGFAALLCFVSWSGAWAVSSASPFSPLPSCSPPAPLLLPPFPLCPPPCHPPSQPFCNSPGTRRLHPARASSPISRCVASDSPR